MSTINVGIADLNVCSGTDILATYALGSCIGICLYDEKAKIAGLAHIMLPWSKDASKQDNMRRYADTGIWELYNLMKQRGASFPGTVAKIAGGAQMFQANSGVFNIGERNIQAVKIVLSKLNIPIVAEDTGLNYGRTVFFDAQTGTMQVKSAMNPTKNL